MGRIAKQLTEKQVQAQSRKVGRLAVGGVPGLILKTRESKAGLRRHWYVRKQTESGETYVPLGSYDTVTLAEAREKAREALKCLSEGVNPAVEAKLRLKAQKEALQTKQNEDLTFGDLLGEWLDWKVANGHWKNAEETRRKEELRIRANLQALFPVSVAKATPEDIANVLRPFWCSKRATADKLQAHLGGLRYGFFQWAMMVKKCRLVGLNPAETRWLVPLLSVESRRKKESHQPALEPEQLPSLIKALWDRRDLLSATCTLVAILTCVRSENVRKMRWSQLNDDLTLWTIDAEEMKVTRNGQHLIPLSSQVRELLLLQKQRRFDYDSPYVFASETRRGEPLSAGTLNQIIKKLHADDVASGGDGWLDRKITKEKGRPVIAVQHGISRSTFEVWAHNTRQDGRAITLILHHSIDPRLNSAYDRGDDLPYKKLVLEAWGDFCFSDVTIGD